MSESAPEEVKQLLERELPIEWYVPDSVVRRYATNMVVQHTDQEFIISFFDIKPPLIVGEPSQEMLENLKSIRAECVAQIIVTAARMPKFVEALQTNLKNALSEAQARQAEE